MKLYNDPKHLWICYQSLQLETLRDSENWLIMTGPTVYFWVIVASLGWHCKDASFYVTVKLIGSNTSIIRPWKGSGWRACDLAADKCNNSQKFVAQTVSWLLRTGSLEIESSGYKPTGQKLELLVLATCPGHSGVGRGSGHPVSYV